MMKRVLAGVCVVAAVGIWGCGNGAAPAAGKAKVGLLISGSRTDGGWNQLAVDDLNVLAKGQNIDVRPREGVAKDQAADAIRQFEADGYTLVIAHGYEYIDTVKELTDPANANRVKIKIAVSGSDADNPNFQSLYYDLSQASYQLGIVAAKVTRSKKLGFIGGQDVPTVSIMAKGFAAGAKSVDPAITVTPQYTGWDDPAAAKRQAEAFMSQGIDVIMQNVDAASRGVFEAVKEHNKAAEQDRTTQQPAYVYTFGANTDQNDNPICGDYTLGSAVIRLDVAFKQSLEGAQSGNFKMGLVKEDLASGVCVAVLNPKLIGETKRIWPETQKLVDEAGKKLIAGEIKIVP